MKGLIFLKKTSSNTLSFKIKNLSLQAQNQICRFAMSALRSLYFKTVISKQLSCI